MEKIPSEIITNILKYLPFDDRRQMALVNTTCNFATVHPIFAKKELFNYDQIKYDTPQGTSDEKICFHAQKFDHFKSAILNTQKGILNLKLDTVTHGQLNDIISVVEISERILSLHIVNLDVLNDSFLDSITNKCINLQELVLDQISNVTLTIKSQKQLLNLKSITLDRTDINDRDFNILMKLAPNLTDINFDSARIVKWPQVIKRFYPNYRDSNFITVYNSDDVLTSINVVNVFKTFKKLINLSLNQCCFIFFQLSSDVKLESLKFKEFLCTSGYEPLSNLDEINLKLSEHISLRKLKIDLMVCCTLTAVSKLHNLRHLNVKVTDNFCSTKTCVTKFFESLENLTNLKKFHFNKLPNTSNTKSTVVISTSQMSNLTSLQLLNCLVDDGLKLINCGGNLINLQFSNGDKLKSEDFQLLFKNLTNLKHLCIDNCINLKDIDLLKSPISNLKRLISLKLLRTNLSYRCFEYIKCLDLKCLSIGYLSVGSKNGLEDITDFENSLKHYSGFVPSLIDFELILRFGHFKRLTRLHDLPEVNLRMKSYFKRLNTFELTYSTNDL